MSNNKILMCNILIVYVITVYCVNRYINNAMDIYRMMIKVYVVLTNKFRQKVLNKILLKNHDLTLLISKYGKK